MTVLAFALFAVAVVVLVLVHRHTQRVGAERLYERHKMMDKQAKVVVRDVQRTRMEAERINAATLDLQQSMHALMRDDRVQRLLNEAESRA